MARRIAFINYKGGVGKTSLIVNTAAALARRGLRVLLVDLDTQANASIWLLKLERWNRLNTMGVGALYSIYDPGTARLRDLVVPDVVEDRAGARALPGLDLIPTTFNLVDLEAEYPADARRPCYVIFQEQLAEIEADYDVVLFDCPPNILRASQNAIFCAQEICVPANPDALSLIGFTLLVEKLTLFQQRSASFRTAAMGPAAQVQGIVFNAIKTNVDIEVPRMRMQLRLNQFKAQRRGVAPDARIHATQIRDAMVVRRSVTLGLPVCLVGHEAEAADSVAGDYARLAAELCSQESTRP